MLYVRTVMRVNKKNPSNVAMGERIKLARETAGLTQEKLAEAVGMSNVTHKLSSLSTEQLKILERGIDVMIVALKYETKKE